VQVTLDALDPNRLASFWADVLGYVVQPPPPGYPDWNAFADAVGLERDIASAVIDPEGAGPRMFFQRVPEAKEVKNRMHLDVNVGGASTGDERRAAVRARATELEAAGATLLREVDQPHGWCLVLADPEGNEFCLQ
jgi:Glyoxalase-like domain